MMISRKKLKTWRLIPRNTLVASISRTRPQFNTPRPTMLLPELLRMSPLSSPLLTRLWLSPPPANTPFLRIASSFTPPPTIPRPRQILPRMTRDGWLQWPLTFSYRWSIHSPKISSRTVMVGCSPLYLGRTRLMPFGPTSRPSLLRSRSHTSADVATSPLVVSSSSNLRRGLPNSWRDILVDSTMENGWGPLYLSKLVHSMVSRPTPSDICGT